MIVKGFPMKVLGKTEEEKGLIFKKKVYKVALLVNNCNTTTREVPFDQYCIFQIGCEYMIEMYSFDGNTWYFSPRR